MNESVERATTPPPPPSTGSWAAPTLDSSTLESVDVGSPSAGAPPEATSVADKMRNARSGIDSEISKAQVPFDSITSGVAWWYRPLIEARMWTALGSLFVGAVWAPLAAAVLLLAVTVTGSLLLVGVGVLLIVPTAGLINAFASVERARAGWVGDPIATPRLAAAGPGVWSKLTTPLSDGARWKQLLFFALFQVGGPVLFVLGLLPWAVLLQLVLGADFDADEFRLFGLLVAALLVGAVPRVTVGVAWLGRAFTEALLGPSETEELQERVTELSGQRQQILDAVAHERRRIERNLHDGVQQQLVALGIDIGRAKARIDTDPGGAAELLDEARDKVRGSIGELRLIGRGLHPAVLEDRGLDAALSAVVASAPIPISVQITSTQQLPDDIASTAYYVANEAVANMLKHSHARVGSIRVDDHPRIRGAVRLAVHDDGQGGADARQGSGLAGMRARVEAVDGMLDVDSPPGGPTRVVAVLPVDAMGSNKGREDE